jgi:hypothetical protein
MLHEVAMTWPLAAVTQQPERAGLVGVLMSTAADRGRVSYTLDSCRSCCAANTFSLVPFLS